MSKMNKKKKAVYVVFFSIILTYITYQSLKVQNAFDEMYYEEMNLIKPYTFRNTSFDRSNCIGYWSRGDAITMYEDFPIQERYLQKCLPENMESLEITFYFLEKNMRVDINHEILEGLSIGVAFTYWIDNKVLEKEVYIIDRREENKTDSYFIDDENRVKKYLSELQIDREMIEKLYHEGIENILLKDWFSVHNSRFSMDYIGRINMQDDFDKYFDEEYKQDLHF